VFNLGALTATVILLVQLYQDVNLLIFNTRFLARIKPVQLNVAPEALEDDFATIIQQNDLQVNSSQATYGKPDEKTKDVMVTYTLALEGNYLNFLNYLRTLVSNKLINKMEQLSLTIKSPEKIDIKLQMECIYDK
jgi:hypothetical protein